MALGQRLELSVQDGADIQVNYDGRDLRAWEGEFDRSALTEDLSVTMLCWLGWNAAKRQGLLNGHPSSWEGFDSVCTGVRVVRDESAPANSADPTQPSPGPA
jgi:hypothetical protein